ncbi:MAG: dihydropyrimidinase [Chloroflexi bacterium]|nr:dihydropyrimidinase [Chloroflexota bacterium]
MFDLIIRNGQIVSPSGIYHGDIAVEGEQVVCIGKILEGAKQIIDASGCYVMPGLVDAHVHLNCTSWNAVSANDYYHGTVAAALGGVTTFIDFAGQTRGLSMRQSVDTLRSQINGETVIDYGLHVSITDDRPETLNEIEQIIANGIPSFKMFMTYRSHNIMVDDDMMLRICERISSCGGLPGVHAENDAIAGANYARFAADGKLTPKYHALAKPPYVEAEAVNRAIFIANIAQSPLYIYHLTTESSIESVKIAKISHQKVLAETCVHYLFLDRHMLDQPDGVNYICSPPLRDKADQEFLWQAIQEGDIAVLSTDDAAFNASDKRKALGGPIENIPNGLPGIGIRLPVVFTLGVDKKKISLERFVEINCENPARIFGLYPKKGSLQPGSDADIIVIDPQYTVNLNVQSQNMHVDWCQYDGLDVRGFPKFTIARGKIIVSNYKYCGEKGRGNFVPGTIQPEFIEKLFY